MIANGHPISSWPRNKYSWSLSFSLCILYTYIQALCVEKECQKPFGFSLFLLFVEFDGGEEKENFLIRVFYLCLEFG